MYFRLDHMYRQVCHCWFEQQQQQHVFFILIEWSFMVESNFICSFFFPENKEAIPSVRDGLFVHDHLDNMLPPLPGRETAATTYIVGKHQIHSTMLGSFTDPVK